MPAWPCKCLRRPALSEMQTFHKLFGDHGYDSSVGHIIHCELDQIVA